MDGLNMVSMVCSNFIPVVIGNIIGGSVMLAAFYYIALKKID